MFGKTVLVGFGLILASGGWAADEKADGSCEGAGPQSPRDITIEKGSNSSRWAFAPEYKDMNLCNIHFHRFAEHKSPAFGRLGGEDENRGYICENTRPKLKLSERSEDGKGCKGVIAGDTVEVHWVFSSCNVKPGATLNSCFNPKCKNPTLRVEARVFYLTDGKAGELDFANYDVKGNQPKSLPKSKELVRYLGSTTGPKYTEESCSPFQVSWSVGAECSPLSMASLDRWCENNVFKEDHAHGVRNIVRKEELLSPIN
ncbi:delta-class carbonic anhydrase [Pseudobacteriovorax antillogorgiicola]|uniref:Cadmium carbonic anhydrase repeat-containing protein n=1 Tax=Pseudobacteriovorax antillogorgiicola TaxID=1513793 RepID=A0A1Y6CF06_9BACT|nr:delta-class carbonic anhydrase [Pseudobacteriovorax antillogorgiicola]TCS47920.1 hypothetical protein EDD56_11931 [Pseudobacteriovorax antillogorgiicola]SMF57913.1 hypothetical protein SAMN06296036_11932 [Pseudobacteriovorax antillogorgiicola]